MSKASDIFAEPLAWLFWPATRPRTDSAWLGHIPFAHWIIGAARPKLLVELGTHSGASHAGFCEGVVRNGFDTRCFAVDTWEGDKHVGGYGEDIYAGLETFNRERYAAFSTLLRKTFDDALGDFADGSIDLLHIDGLHTYEAVKHDFESWQPKLSDRAVVLFHDTSETRDDFGVWRFWGELSTRYPSFAFTHFHGLGVLQVGAALDGPATALFALDDEAERQVVRDRFEALGNGVRNIAYAARMHYEAHRLDAVVKQLTGRRGTAG
jgi:hypothetical protein